MLLPALLSFVWVGAAAAPPAQAPAQARGRASAAPPVVVMIRVAERGEGENRERRLFDELGFALDGFAVLSQPAPSPEFARLPLDEQIAQVLPQARENSAMAVVWMSLPLAHQVMLHLVALGSGRALVRTIETDRSPVSESSLALMARELLGTAYLFEPPADIPIEVSNVVHAVKQQIPKDPEPAAEPPAALEEPSPWGVSVWARSDYPLAGGADALPVLRASLELDRDLPWHLVGSLGGCFGYAAVDRPNAAGSSFFLGGATAHLFRDLSSSAVAWGPQARATFEYGTFASAGGGAQFGVPTFGLGAFAGTRAAKGVRAGVGLLAVYAPVQAELVASDGTLLYRTPSWALQMELSIGWKGF